MRRLLVEADYSGHLLFKNTIKKNLALVLSLGFGRFYINSINVVLAQCAQIITNL